MTEIAFHFNVPDKLAYSCRLLRKAHASGAQVVITGEVEQLAALDQLLWTFSATEFVPHCRTACGDTGSGSVNAITQATSPILLAESPKGCAHHGVLVNLGSRIPDEFERFERFVELVTQNDGDKQAARLRWKHYTDRGYIIKRHDLSTAVEAA